MKPAHKRDLLGLPNRGREGAAGLRIAERELDKVVDMVEHDDPRAPSTLLIALRESGESAAEFYRAWANVLPKVLPTIDWSKPFFYDWNAEPVYYADQRDFYAREIAPFLGEYEKLREVMLRVDSGQLTDAEAKREVRESATLAKQGGARPGAGRPANGAEPEERNQPDNVRLNYGNEASYTLARLDRDHADLAAEVRAGRMTANAAAIQAGFRRRMVSLPAEPAAMAQAIINRYPEAARLIVESHHA